MCRRGRDPLSQSLPLITIVDPLLAIIIGGLAFHETIASSAALQAGQVLGFLGMSAGVVLLSRRPTPAPAAADDEKPACPLNPVAGSP